MRFLKFFASLLFVSPLFVRPLPAEQAPFSSASISGLGARKIDSATMSGRVSALAAAHEPSGKLTIFVGAASGGVWKSEDGGTHYRPVFDEKDINLEQVKAGMAWHYKDYEREQSPAEREIYARAEDEARKARRGLWIDANPVEPSEFRIRC